MPRHAKQKMPPLLAKQQAAVTFLSRLWRSKWRYRTTRRLANALFQRSITIEHFLSQPYLACKQMYQDKAVRITMMHTVIRVFKLCHSRHKPSPKLGLNSLDVLEGYLVAYKTDHFFHIHNALKEQVLALVHFARHFLPLFQQFVLLLTTSLFKVWVLAPCLLAIALDPLPLQDIPHSTSRDLFHGFYTYSKYYFAWKDPFFKAEILRQKTVLLKLEYNRTRPWKTDDESQSIRFKVILECNRLRNRLKSLAEKNAFNEILKELESAPKPKEDPFSRLVSLFFRAPPPVTLCWFSAMSSVCMSFYGILIFNSLWTIQSPSHFMRSNTPQSSN